jgi:hypothetical protein
MAATDDFVSKGARTDPITSAAAVTPSDSVDLGDVTRALYVGVAGDVTVVMLDGQTVTFTAMPVGWHPIRAKRVKSTGTAATNIVACW